MKKLSLLCLVTLVSLGLYLLWDMNYDIFDYVIRKRMEKVVAMMIVGVSIGLSTLTFQSITNNRILTPSILGLDSLYLMMQLLTVTMFSSMASLLNNPYLNFFIAAALLTLVASLIYKWVFLRSSSMYFMVLVGIVMGTMFSSINGMLQIMISPDVYNLVMDKMFANFSIVNEKLILVSLIINGLVMVQLVRKRYLMDTLSLGRDYSINLGVDYDREVLKLLLPVFVLVSVSTALVGPVTFLGFFAANMARVVLKTYKHTYLYIGTCMVGVSVLLIGQFFIEHLFDFGLPISVLISMIGGTYFIYMLMKENKR